MPYQEQINQKAAELQLGNSTMPGAVEVRSGRGTFGYHQVFERGHVYQHYNSAAAIYGTILEHYIAGGAHNSPLGFPVADEMSCSFLNGSRLSVCENGRIYWDNQTNQAFTLAGYSPITAGNFYNIGGPGTCFPKVKLWLDAARGVHSFEGGRTSIWYDLVNGNTGHGLRASTTQSGMWPVATMASGFPALRFGEFNNGVSNQKKGLPIHSEGGTPFSLWETPYTIFAVVQRDSGRGENYFLKTDGLNCGLLGCEENSALHLGWRGDRTIRFGQYGNDVDIQDVPPFDGDNPAIVLVTAQSDEHEKIVSIDMAGFCKTVSKRDGRLLKAGNRNVHIGASTDRQAPGYWFSGFIFELIICDARLPEFITRAMKEHLKRKYRLFS